MKVEHTRVIEHTTICGAWKVVNDHHDVWLYEEDTVSTEIGPIESAKELHAALTKFIELYEAENAAVSS